MGGLRQGSRELSVEHVATSDNAEPRRAGTGRPGRSRPRCNRSPARGPPRSSRRPPAPAPTRTSCHVGQCVPRLSVRVPEEAALGVHHEVAPDHDPIDVDARHVVLQDILDANLRRGNRYDINNMMPPPCRRRCPPCRARAPRGRTGRRPAGAGRTAARGAWWGRAVGTLRTRRQDQLISHVQGVFNNHRCILQCAQLTVEVWRSCSTYLLREIYILIIILFLK